tara:strand:+ start:37 stop:915 length:879 start_codon:yes stop_codon:yes gene_type:complete
MTSKIVVNNIEADAGVSTVTFNSNIVRGGSNLHSTGLALGAGSTIGAVTGVTTYYGDGSQLSNITSTTINNNADNRIITGSGTANRLEGESNLTFNGTNLLSVHVPSATGEPAINFTNSDTGTGTSNGFGIGISGAESPYIYNRENTDIRIATNNTERVRITKEGYVTKPNTPAFQVARTSGDVSSNNYVIFNTVYYNNGSHYDTSNGRFTAPVTGIYHFYAWHFTGGTSQFRLDLNGSSWQGANTLWDDVGGHASWTMPMTTGQYVQIYTQSYAWRGTANYHNAFGGYMIG